METTYSGATLKFLSNNQTSITLNGTSDQTAKESLLCLHLKLDAETNTIKEEHFDFRDPVLTILRTHTEH